MSQHRDDFWKPKPLQLLAVANYSFQPSAQPAGHQAARRAPALRGGSHKAGDGVNHLDLSTHPAEWGTHTTTKVSVWYCFSKK